MKRNPEKNFKGSGNNSSNEAKKIVRLRRKLKDAQDAYGILKKQSAYWTSNPDLLLAGIRKSYTAQSLLCFRCAETIEVV